MKPEKPKKKLDDFNALPPVSNDVDLAFYENGLKVDKNALDDALEEQPKLIQDVCERLAQAISRRDQAKDIVKRVEAELYLDFKAAADEAGERCTEAYLSAKITRHPRRVEAFTQYIKFIEEVERWDGMRESYRQRGFSLGTLGDLFGQSYFTRNSVTGTSHTVRQAEYEENRRKMAEGRRAK